MITLSARYCVPKPVEWKHRRQHGCSDTAVQKKAEGWKRDLSEKVRNRVRSKLRTDGVRSRVRTKVRNDGVRSDANLDDETVIEEKANENSV